MRTIFGAVVLATSFALLNGSWAGQDKEKKQDKKEKVLEVGKGLDIASSLDNARDKPYSNADTEAGNQDKQAHQAFLVKFVKGKTYQIDMIKADDAGMDPYLFLLDPKGKTVAQDDDSGGGLNSQILFKAPDDGIYRIICTTFGGAGEGDFTLKVSEK